jgi:hypothetical protein
VKKKIENRKDDKLKKIKARAVLNAPDITQQFAIFLKIIEPGRMLWMWTHLNRALLFKHFYLCTQHQLKGQTWRLMSCCCAASDDRS